MSGVVVLIDDTVPDGMQLISPIVVLKGKIISALVPSWVLLAVSVAAVERLMDVTHVVDDKSKGKRLTLIFSVDVLHDGLIGSSLGNISTTKPIIDVWHSRCDVLRKVSYFEVRGLGTGSVNWLVVEVPVRLPSATSSFVVVWEGDALNEWVPAFVLFGKIVTVDPQK